MSGASPTRPGIIGIPAGIAMELALTGDPLPAADAYRLGLVNALTLPGAALGWKSISR